VTANDLEQSFNPVFWKIAIVSCPTATSEIRRSNLTVNRCV